MATGTTQVPDISFKEFLERIPPGTFSQIIDLGTKLFNATGPDYCKLGLPEITLHCDTEGTCGGDRVFSTNYSKTLRKDDSDEAFVHYTCKNCSKRTKIFALWVQPGENLKAGTAYKYGEYPNFGPPNPPRLITLIRPQRDLFLKGRRAENQGM